VNMKKKRGVSKYSGVLFFFTIVILLPGSALGQKEISDLQFEEQQIIGKDTRVFTISGDRVSTVEFIDFILTLPISQRRIETSQGLISDEERLWKSESFEMKKGPYTRADIFLGSRTLSNIWGKASIDLGATAGTLQLTNRDAEENTPTNSPPSIEKLNAAGYYDTSQMRLSANIGVSSESDKLHGKSFRSREREVGRYNSGFTMNTEFAGSWDLKGRINLAGGSYKDKELDFNKKEFVIDGDISAVGDIYDVTVIFDSSADFIKHGEDSGSIASIGVKGKWLSWGNVGLQAGAYLYVSAIPNENAEFKRSLELGVDWAVSTSKFVRISYKPGIERHSFGDLYDLNGLVKPLLEPLQMLFQDKKIDLTGEFGWRHSTGLEMKTGVFFLRTEKALIFNRAGDFFDVLQDAEVDIKGFNFSTQYDCGGNWGIDSKLTFNYASWDSTEKVPYIPVVETVIDTYVVPRNRWILRSALRYMSKHYLETTSGADEDFFFTIDFGVERELFKYLSVYVDIRNIANYKKGSWWTKQYAPPGIGIYGGLKARY